ncbi:AraC family transcriptional regulator [Legionella wadsworthii]|uniref:Pseudouridine-5'-phosphate glycosidase n=1 Tax=Legionella wadsworthii TaxID=28088 RepID=A0A378LVS9_9GAMM|nr:pseudouridine-5'-phosphate glycosidase [Legionella wadsworthii]STY30989.1 AraC family transcriptional regulator [Legionella wadsworthii]
MNPFFDYSPEVKDALDHKKPILALESTLISHGMPYPHNYETAKAVEDIIREYEVIPATIAVINGRIKIGLTADELRQFACNKDVLKASRRDLPFIVTNKYSAGTTVAATLFCAAKAGIQLFATGGIGGVHRGEAQDISADLIEIARTPVAVICAGAKAILDLPRTLEFLETLSIPVIGYRTQVLPAFYTDVTNYSLSNWVEDVPSLASLLNAHWQLDTSSGILITNPIPTEFNIPMEVIEPAITNALQKAEQNHISGKALTPFLLSEISHLTQGKSLHANIALIKNNARLGAELARVVGSFSEK